MEMGHTQLFVLLPILGALSGLFFRNKQSVLVCWFSFLCAFNAFLFLLMPPPFVAAINAPLCFMVACSGIWVVLGRSPSSEPALDLFHVLILSGLGLGFMLNPQPLGHFFLIGVLAFLIQLQWRARNPLDNNLQWIIGLYGLGLCAIVASFFLSGIYRQVVLLVVYAMLLPLFPISSAYVIHLKSLRGVLPAFLSIFLPMLGLHGLLPIVPVLPAEIKQLLFICALVGTTVGALRILIQIQIPKLLAQGALVFWSILWWYLAGSGGAMAPAVIFSIGCALTLCGLFLSWHGLNSRYGNLLLEQFGGLAKGMPRFALLFSFLMMAAVGLPFFGVFSGFMEMVFSSPLIFSWGILLILTAWFILSWRFPIFMQQLLFGPTKQGWIYVDFGKREIAALSIIVGVLILLGVAPYRLFGLLNLPNLSVQIVETVLWQQ